MYITQIKFFTDDDRCNAVVISYYDIREIVVDSHSDSWSGES